MVVVKIKDGENVLSQTGLTSAESVKTAISSILEACFSHKEETSDKVNELLEMTGSETIDDLKAQLKEIGELMENLDCATVQELKEYYTGNIRKLYENLYSYEIDELCDYPNLDRFKDHVIEDFVEEALRNTDYDSVDELVDRVEQLETAINNIYEEADDVRS